MVSSEEREAIERWRSIGQPGETKEQYLTRVGGTDPVTGKTYPQPKYETRGGELYAVYTPTQTNAVSSSKPTQPLNVVQNAMREVSSPGIQQIEQRRQQSIAYNEASRQNALQNLGVKPRVVSSERKNALQEIIKKPASGPAYSSKTSTTSQTYVTRTATTTTPHFVSTSGKEPITRTATSTPVEKKPVNFTEILASPYKKAYSVAKAGESLLGAGFGVTAAAGEFWLGKGSEYVLAKAPNNEAVGVAVGAVGVGASVPIGLARIGEVTLKEGAIAGGTTYVAGFTQTVGRVGFLGGKLIQSQPTTSVEKGELVTTVALTALGARKGTSAIKSSEAIKPVVVSTKIKPFYGRYKGTLKKSVERIPEERVFETTNKFLSEPEASFESGISLQKLRQRIKTRQAEVQITRETTKPKPQITTYLKKTVTKIGPNIPRAFAVGGAIGIAQSDLRLIKANQGDIPSVLTGGKTRQMPSTKQRLFDQEGMSYADLQVSKLKQETSFIPQVLIPGAIITTAFLTGGGGGGGERGFSMDIPGFPGGGGFGFGRRGNQFGRGSAYTPSLLGLISNKKASKAFKLQGIYSPGTIRGR